jgi:hypothetical protein
VAVDEKQRLLEQEEEIKDLLAAVPGGIFKYEAKRRGSLLLSAPSCYGC